jgi:hypothetical protein
MDLNEKLAAKAAEHRERQAALEAGILGALERIDTAVSAHTLQYFENLLAAGRPEADALEAAKQEAARHRQHLAMAALQIADPSVKNVDLFCANCGAVTPHGTVVDHNAETVATCACGRFRKFAAGVVPRDDAQE